MADDDDEHADHRVSEPALAMSLSMALLPSPFQGKSERRPAREGAWMETWLRVRWVSLEARVFCPRRICKGDVYIRI